MRLKSLKLSGFKSFVDSTKFSFPTNLSGIVGPNGCGKSNTIDAVRWVMGERSAKHLRGDSMSDVIFNGAKTRKPVGQASVELIFDNSSGRIQGQYAAYNEISVRRAVSREGISNYYLNGSKCRRRDIMDLFLGTGLGPRSYAIIEQGMISRLVEARPDDLRGMIEEAAGISKYKERRRDTENRIRHTKENLSRIIDLRDEIEKLIKRLKRQVKAAKKYKAFKKEERILKAEILSLKWQEQSQKHQEWQGKIKNEEVALEAELAKLQTISTQLEKTNQKLITANDNLAKIQAENYQVNSEISATEQTLKSSKERLNQLQEDLDTLLNKIQKDQTDRQNDAETATELAAWLKSNSEKLSTLSQEYQRTDKIKTEAENKWNDWQNIWGQLQQDVLKSEQKTGFVKAKIEQLETQQTQLNLRKQKINTEISNLPQAEEADESLVEKIAIAREELTESNTLKNKLIKNLKTARDTTHKLNNEVDNLKQNKQQTTGRIESLKTLKQNALGKNDNLLNTWLEASKLTDSDRLYERIKIKPGWEHAAQICLTDFINGICVNDDKELLNSLAQANDFNASILDFNKAPSKHEKLGPSLDEVIESQIDLRMFSHIYIAETDTEANALRPKLKSGESVISKDGLWLGANWIRKVDLHHAEHNILNIEHELNQQESRLSQLDSGLFDLLKQLDKARTNQEQTEAELDALHEKVNTAQRKLAGLEADKTALDTKNQHIKTRRKQLAAEIKEIEQIILSTEKDIGEGRQELNSALNLMHQFADEKLELEPQKDSLHGLFIQTRQDADTAHNSYHNLAVEFESKQSRLDEINHHINRSKNQYAEEKAQENTLRKRIEDSKAPINEMEQKLKNLLQSQLELDKKLSNARSEANEIEYARHQEEDSQRQIENKIQQSRNKLENLRLQAQESNVRAATLSEQLQGKNLQPEQYLENLPQDASINGWQEKISALERKIERLGAINLAAVDEYKTESERKTYIDKQHADLTEALDTLESAIGKIDQETKSRFNETFDVINQGLQKNFPILFGGGRSYLELTSDDLLEAGVNVMAQPPGKRNSTIHLLSGGEKALTAVALVFAIFELNPAPFCMLDEVDAPLDDANVERFCQMVKEMSERIQFIIVTHNKITMELANQLTGVTMQEAGVSRMVTVNLDEAAKMVEE